MNDSTLRSLAKAYSKGAIKKEDYRKTRANLINGILSNDVPLRDIDYPPLVAAREDETLEVTERRPVKKKLI